MDQKYAEQIAHTLHEIELADERNGAKATRANVASNMHKGAPANAEELLHAAHAADSITVCARCGKELTSDFSVSLYVPLPICDLCAVQETAMELMNSPLPFSLWHCCMEPIETPVMTPPQVDPESTELWYCRDQRGADAVGLFERGGITVLQGSKVADQMTPGFENGKDSAARKRMLEDGTIDSSFTFTKDVHFSFPSSAGKVVLGHSCNGWTVWVNKEGVQLETLRYR